MYLFFRKNFKRFLTIFFLFFLCNFYFAFCFGSYTDLDINAKSYVVIDRNSKQILIGKNENNKVKMASTTKIMTSTIIIENCNLNDVVTVSKKAANTGGSRLGLHENDKINVNDLLYGLMLRSGNDAAVCLAEYCSGDIPNFCKLMNNKAKYLGLHNTNFETPHGLDSDNHYTTAYELAILTDYALHNEIFCKIVGTKNCTININGSPKNLSSTNELLGNLDGIYGVKTGFTNGANRCLVSACKRGDMDIICVVLGCDTKKFRTQDSIHLINFCFDNYEYVNLKKLLDNKINELGLNNSNYFNIKKGVSNDLKISYNNFYNNIIPLNKNIAKTLDVNILVNKDFVAPLLKNTSVGSFEITTSNGILLKGNLVANNSIRKKTIKDFLFNLEF